LFFAVSSIEHPINRNEKAGLKPLFTIEMLFPSALASFALAPHNIAGYQKCANVEAVIRLTGIALLHHLPPAPLNCAGCVGVAREERLAPTYLGTLREPWSR